MTRLIILPLVFGSATFFLYCLLRYAPPPERDFWLEEWRDSTSKTSQPPVHLSTSDAIDPYYRADGDQTDHTDQTETFQTARTATSEPAGSATSGSDGSVSSDVRTPTTIPPVSWSLPQEFENFTRMAEKFRIYKENHFEYITTTFVAAYLYKQTFAIPGSFFLNIIAGVLFGLWYGFFLVCMLTTLGSTLCYLFSELFAREYVLYYFGQKINYLQQKVDDNSNRLLPFLLFARMFPISPSWLLNIVAPFLNIPLPIFAISAFIGLAPYNFVCVQAGYILGTLNSWDDILDTYTLLKLCSMALLPLAYAIFVRPNKSSFENSITNCHHYSATELPRKSDSILV